MKCSPRKLIIKGSFFSFLATSKCAKKRHFHFGKTVLGAHINQFYTHSHIHSQQTQRALGFSEPCCPVYSFRLLFSFFSSTLRTIHPVLFSLSIPPPCITSGCIPSYKYVNGRFMQHTRIPENSVDVCLCAEGALSQVSFGWYISRHCACKRH